MKLIYLGKTYECASAEKKPNEIVIHTGRYEDDEEIIYHIFGDIDFDSVILEGGTWTEEAEAQPSEAERIAELEEALAMLLNGVTE